MSDYQQVRLKGIILNRRLFSYLIALIIVLALLVGLSIRFVAAFDGIIGSALVGSFPLGETLIDVKTEKEKG